MSAPVLPANLRDFDFTEVAEMLELRAGQGSREQHCPPVPPNRIKATIDDFREFVWLYLCYPTFPLVPSAEIDEVWHQAILFEEVYARFKREVYSNTPMPHVPRFGRGLEPHEAETILANTQALFDKVFGAVPPSYAGMGVTELVCGSSGSSGTVDLRKEGTYLSWKDQEELLRSL